jgi:hypothetical protein
MRPEDAVTSRGARRRSVMSKMKVRTKIKAGDNWG